MNDPRPCLFTTPDFGLANRLRGLVALWAYAKKHKRDLHVLWTESEACPYRIEDLFDPLPNTTYLTNRDSPPSEDAYSTSSSDLGHLSHSLPKYGIPYAMAPLLIASLVPVEPLRQRIRAMAASVPLSQAIGLHVRSTDHVDYAKSLGGGTPLQQFYTIADAYPSKPLFLACDDVQTVKAFRDRYGDRIHVAKEFGPLDASTIRQTAGDHAVLDLYCLALCQGFQGSQFSSFSAHVDYLRQAWSKSPSLLHKTIGL